MSESHLGLSTFWSLRRLQLKGCIEGTCEGSEVHNRHHTRALISPDTGRSANENTVNPLKGKIQPCLIKRDTLEAFLRIHFWRVNSHLIWISPVAGRLIDEHRLLWTCVSPLKGNSDLTGVPWRCSGLLLNAAQHHRRHLSFFCTSTEAIS